MLTAYPQKGKKERERDGEKKKNTHTKNENRSRSESCRCPQALAGIIAIITVIRKRLLRQVLPLPLPPSLRLAV